MRNILRGDVNERQKALSTLERQQEPYLARLNKATDDFITKLKHIERRSSHAPAVADELLILTTKAITAMTDACAEFERSGQFDRIAVKHARMEFREKTRELFSTSYFMTRTRTWPRGYAGDYETLEGIYRNSPKSNGLGYYLDRYFLATTLPAAVRDRKNFLRDLLKKELGRRRAPRVLDIASGSCREVFELTPDIVASKARFTFVDMDPDALAFAGNRLGYTGIPPEQMVFRKYNAVKMVKHDRNVKEFGMQDIIYSVGFFDYLPDDTLVPLLASLYELLNPGGALITSFKDCRRYRSQEYHWFVDWDGFYQRTEEQIQSIFQKAGIPGTAIHSVRDASEVIIFLTAVK
jgi:SAM-dependent methyltransferase